MLDRIAHRGPDGRGIAPLGKIILGHVRLSILDLTDRAAQPMTSHDGRLSLTYNGEVYNFAELRDRLEQRNIKANSSGDTEVLLEHIAQFGLHDTLPRIEGFFSFALWDAEDEVLVLARDRLGKKPLYWSEFSGEIRFASEQKALVTGGTLPDRPSVESMLLGFSANFGTHTAFEGIHAVEPGGYVEFRRSCSPRCIQWFRLEELIDPELHLELQESEERDVILRSCKAFEESLRYRLVSDVSVASLVSGGVDSSLVTVMAASMGATPELYHADVVEDSERHAAELVAGAVSQRLHAIKVDDHSLLSGIARATWYNDQPLTYHVNAIPFLRVCELAQADGVKVLLSGEGSDELFLGYPQYGLAPYLDAVDAAKAKTRKLTTHLAPRIVQQIWPSLAESHERMLRSLVSRSESDHLLRVAQDSGGHLTARSEQRAHLACIPLMRSHLVSLFHRNDRLGMASGIENRFPLLGNELVRLGLNLPARYKLRWERRTYDLRHPFITDKWIVRRMARQRLPESLAMRRKEGFPVRLQQRVVVAPELFDSGFLSEYWGLDTTGFERMLEKSTPTWALRLALVEIWGRMYFLNESIDETSTLLLHRLPQRTSAI